MDTRRGAGAGPPQAHARTAPVPRTFIALILFGGGALVPVVGTVDILMDMQVLAALAADDRAIVVAIVALRLLVPLLIPRCPLVIVLALTLDAVDNSVLARFTGVDLSADGPYQSWDKALDIYYLAVAYLSTLRNWTSDPAVRIGRFLFYYRLVGIALFELLDSRAMLLLFPNTFEYFFIAYEATRLRFDPARWSARFWLLVAAVLWVFVKLPQEYWIHIAQRDVTDTVSANPAVGVLACVLLAALCAFALIVVRPRLPAPSGSGRLAAGPLALGPEEAHLRHARRLADARAFWSELAEKIALLALLCVIFAEVLPSVVATFAEVTVAVAVIVTANATVSVAYATHGRVGIESAAARLVGLLAMNFAFVVLASWALTDDNDFQLGAGLFFAFLATLIIWLYDVYEPVRDARSSSAGEAASPFRPAG